MLQEKLSVAIAPKLLDVVELLSDVSEEGDGVWGGMVKAGAQGTIVEELPGRMYLVEFDTDADTTAILTLPERVLRVRWTPPN